MKKASDSYPYDGLRRYFLHEFQIHARAGVNLVVPLALAFINCHIHCHAVLVQNKGMVVSLWESF